MGMTNKKLVLEALKGTVEELFMLLSDYCYNLVLHNPKTMTYIKTYD